MSVPTTYSQWVVCLDEFKKGQGDEENVLLMEKGTVPWTEGVAERLIQRLYDAIESRLRLSGDQLNRDLNQRALDETSMVKALLSARKRLAVLKRMTDLQAFPKKVRDAMLEMLVDHAQQMQQSLEKTARDDRTGRLRSVIRNNAITRFGEVENVFGGTTSYKDSSSQKPEWTPGPKSTKRRVILR
ncbi:HK97 gp10 family phage protein [Rossellomorea marisflavi]|uniref:HK97 gp10 family phage protein n=1 Tax=Rossellomorea marisflavi TaxID=189381 RepID=UPI00345A7E96